MVSQPRLKTSRRRSKRPSLMSFARSWSIASIAWTPRWMPQWVNGRDWKQNLNLDLPKAIFSFALCKPILCRVQCERAMAIDRRFEHVKICQTPNVVSNIWELVNLFWSVLFVVEILQQTYIMHISKLLFNLTGLCLTSSILCITCMAHAIGSTIWTLWLALACQIMTFGVPSMYMFTTMQPNKPNHASVLIQWLYSNFPETCSIHFQLQFISI